MRIKLLSILTALALLALPLIAQAPLPSSSSSTTPVASDQPAEKPVADQPAAQPEPAPAVQPATAPASPSATTSAPAATESRPASAQSSDDTGSLPAAATGHAASEEPESLPKTASPLALLALLGLGSAGSAVSVRVARRR